MQSLSCSSELAMMHHSQPERAEMLSFGGACLLLEDDVDNLFPQKWTDVFQGPGEKLLCKSQSVSIALPKKPLRRSMQGPPETQKEHSAPSATEAHPGPFICCKCGEGFVDRQLFASHQKTHSGSGEYLVPEPKGNLPVKFTPLLSRGPQLLPIPNCTSAPSRRGAQW
ncbi:hypothetical protein E2320_023004 [Naja naja]|nr:hypothetical protein E2320_023004 [Naja naja]